MISIERNERCKYCGSGSCIFLEISHDVNEFRPEEFTQPILYEKGRAIFAQGSSIHGYYIICEGVVKLICHLSSSKQVVVALMGPGDILGLGANE